MSSELAPGQSPPSSPPIFDQHDQEGIDFYEDVCLPTVTLDPRLTFGDRSPLNRLSRRRRKEKLRASKQAVAPLKDISITPETPETPSRRSRSRNHTAEQRAVIQGLFEKGMTDGRARTKVLRDQASASTGLSDVQVQQAVRNLRKTYTRAQIDAINARQATANAHDSLIQQIQCLRRSLEALGKSDKVKSSARLLLSTEAQNLAQELYRLFGSNNVAR